MTYTACPACSSRSYKKTERDSVVECRSCGGIYSRSPMYRGDSYEIVRPHMAAEPVPAEQLVYFDLDVVGSRGYERRHGWFDPVTKLIHQVG